MKKTQFSESKRFRILKEAESSVPVPELCRKYGGMDGSSMGRLKEFEEENRRLKKMYADHLDPLIEYQTSKLDDEPPNLWL